MEMPRCLKPNHTRYAAEAEVKPPVKSRRDTLRIHLTAEQYTTTVPLRRATLNSWHLTFLSSPTSPLIFANSETREEQTGELEELQFTRIINLNFLLETFTLAIGF